jgi:hypothetical protein
MTNGKIVFFLSQGKNGWSESYYTNDTTLDSLQHSAQALYMARFRLLAEPATIDYVRLADAGSLRVSTLTPAQTGGVFNAVRPSYVSDCEVVGRTAEMTIYTVSGHQRKIYLRGAPDDAFNLVQPTNFDAQLFLSYYGEFGQLVSNMATLGTGIWQMREKPRAIFPPNVGANVIAIVTWISTTPSTNTVMGLATAPITPTPFGTVYKAKGLPFSPGLVQVVAVGVNPAVLTIRYRTPADYVYPDGAFYLPYAPVFENISSFSSAPSWSVRRTGRPFGVSRGRRRSILR